MKKVDKIVSYLLINLANEVERNTLIDQLADIKEVTEIHRTYGVYDLVIRIETENANQIKDITIKSIRRLKYVNKTMTMISL